MTRIRSILSVLSLLVCVSLPVIALVKVTFWLYPFTGSDELIEGIPASHYHHAALASIDGAIVIAIVYGFYRVMTWLEAADIHPPGCSCRITFWSLRAIEDPNCSLHGRNRLRGAMRVGPGGHWIEANEYNNPKR